MTAITRTALAAALKGRTAYVTVSGTDLEVKVSHADAEALRNYSSGDVCWWIVEGGKGISIEANAAKNYGGTGDMTDA